MSEQPTPATPSHAMGLTIGQLGPGMGHVVAAARRFQSAVVQELEARGIELSVGSLALLQTAIRFERAALAAQKLCRELDTASPKARLEALQRCAAASAERDKVLRELGVVNRREPATFEKTEPSRVAIYVPDNGRSRPDPSMDDE